MQDTPLIVARKGLGLSQSEMARRVGLESKGFYSRIERDLEQPSVRVALALERETGVDAASLNPEVAMVRAAGAVVGQDRAA